MKNVNKCISQPTNFSYLGWSTLTSMPLNSQTPAWATTASSWNGCPDIPSLWKACTKTSTSLTKFITMLWWVWKIQSTLPTFEAPLIKERDFVCLQRNTLNSGTTLACYFATLHGESSAHLAKVASELGQRAFVGKINMNINVPEFYHETTEQSLKDTERFVDDVLALKVSGNRRILNYS